MSYGVGCRCSSDLALLWLWLAAVALIASLAWEPPYAVSVVLKSKKKKKESDLRLGWWGGVSLAPGPAWWVKGSGVAAAAQIQCLAWELPYTVGTAIKKYIYIKICFCRYILFLIPNIDIAFFLFLICLARDLSIFSVQELPFYFGSFSTVQLLVH